MADKNKNEEYLEDKERINGGDRQGMKVKELDGDNSMEQKYTNAKPTPTRDEASKDGKKIHTILDDKSVKDSVEEALKHDEERLGDARDKA
jgi:hypothetical protein